MSSSAHHLMQFSSGKKRPSVENMTRVEHTHGALTDMSNDLLNMRQINKGHIARKKVLFAPHFPGVAMLDDEHCSAPRHSLQCRAHSENRLRYRTPGCVNGIM